MLRTWGFALANYINHLHKESYKTLYGTPLIVIGRRGVIDKCQVFVRFLGGYVDDLVVLGCSVWMNVLCLFDEVSSKHTHNSPKWWPKGPKTCRVTFTDQKKQSNVDRSPIRWSDGLVEITGKRFMWMAQDQSVWGYFGSPMFSSDHLSAEMIRLIV